MHYLKSCRTGTFPRRQDKKVKAVYHGIFFKAIITAYLYGGIYGGGTRVPRTGSGGKGQRCCVYGYQHDPAG